MADLTAITSWTRDDVLHLARRAGFGLTPEQADAYLVANPGPAAGVDAWVDGTGLSTALFDSVWADRADPVWLAAVSASSTAGSVNVPAVSQNHRYAVDGLDAWRNSQSRAQASWAFRMQYHPYAFAERMALFWHNLFATGNHKVASVALMLQQIATLRQSVSRPAPYAFADLLAEVSRDPAMSIWLDSVLNDAAGSRVPNENYARESMELYSLGADKGYNQQDITQLALALSGWSYVVAPGDRVSNPADPNQKFAARGTFWVYDGSTALPAGAFLWDDLDPGTQPTRAPSMRVSGTRASVTFLGQTFNANAAPAAGQVLGEAVLRSIVTSQAGNCAAFLAARLAQHFVAPLDVVSATDLADLAAAIQAQGFDMKAVLKLLLKSNWFYGAPSRWSLVEGPVSWIVRAARQLGPDLATADTRTPRAFPAWAQLAPAFEQAGMALLDPNGPNGWKEHTAWMNSNTMRFRTKLAAGLALGETFGQGSPAVDTALFPTSVADWFPAVAYPAGPASAVEVFDRLVALLQPAAIPGAVRDAWIVKLWPAGTAFAWDATGQKKARELAFLVLCSPSAQLY